MLFCSKRYKSVFFLAPGCACTFYKKWFYAIHNIKAEHPHCLKLYEEFKINWHEVFIKMDEEDYKFIVIVRNPFSRVYSGIKRKIIKNDTMENIYVKMKKTGDKSLSNVFDYFKTYIEKDMTNYEYTGQAMNI